MTAVKRRSTRKGIQKVPSKQNSEEAPKRENEVHTKPEEISKKDEFAVDDDIFNGLLIDKDIFQADSTQISASDEAGDIISDKLVDIVPSHQVIEKNDIIMVDGDESLNNLKSINNDLFSNGINSMEVFPTRPDNSENDPKYMDQDDQLSSLLEQNNTKSINNVNSNSNQHNKLIDQNAIQPLNEMSVKSKYLSNGHSINLVHVDKNMSLFEKFCTLIMSRNSFSIVKNETVVVGDGLSIMSTLCTEGTPKYVVEIEWYKHTEEEVEGTLLQLFLEYGYGEGYNQILYICTVNEKIDALRLIGAITQHLSDSCTSSHRNQANGPPSELNMEKLSFEGIHLLFHHYTTLLNDFYVRFLLPSQKEDSTYLISTTSNDVLKLELNQLLQYEANHEDVSLTTRKRKRDLLFPMEYYTHRKKDSQNSQHFQRTLTSFCQVTQFTSLYLLSCRNSTNELVKENLLNSEILFAKLFQSDVGKVMWLTIRWHDPKLFFDQIIPILLKLLEGRAVQYIQPLRETFQLLQCAETSWTSPIEYSYLTNPYYSKSGSISVKYIFSILFDQFTTVDIFTLYNSRDSTSSLFDQLLSIRTLHSVSPFRFVNDLINVSFILLTKTKNSSNNWIKLMVISFVFVKLIDVLKLFSKEYQKVKRHVPKMSIKDPIVVAISSFQQNIDEDIKHLRNVWIGECNKRILKKDNDPKEEIKPFETVAQSIFRTYESHYDFVQYIQLFCNGDENTLKKSNIILNFIALNPLCLNIIQLHGLIKGLIIRTLLLIKSIYRDYGKENHHNFSLYMSVLYLIFERFNFRDTPNHKTYLEAVLRRLDVERGLRISLLNYIHPQHLAQKETSMEVGDELLASLMGDTNYAEQFLLRVSPLKVLECIPYVTQQWLVALRSGHLSPNAAKDLIIRSFSIYGVYFEVGFLFTLYHSHRFEVSQCLPVITTIIDHHAEESVYSSIWRLRILESFYWLTDNESIRTSLDSVNSKLERPLRMLSFDEVLVQMQPGEHFELAKLKESVNNIRILPLFVSVESNSKIIQIKRYCSLLPVNECVEYVLKILSEDFKKDKIQQVGFEFGNLVGYPGLKYFIQNILPLKFSEYSQGMEVQTNIYTLFTIYASIRVYSQAPYPCIDGFSHFLERSLTCGDQRFQAFAETFLNILLRVPHLLSLMLFSKKTTLGERLRLANTWRNVCYKPTSNQSRKRYLDFLHFFDFQAMVENNDQEELNAILYMLNE